MTDNLKEALPFLSALVAIIALCYQIWRNSLLLKLQQFSEYTRRYQQIVINFPGDIYDSTFVLTGRGDYKQTMMSMRAYFDLCFEEWYLSNRRLVDKNTWRIWRHAMGVALSRP